MVITLLAWIYITFICLAWGNMLLRVMAPKEPELTTQEPEWPLICLTGLCITGSLSLLLCLFMPLALVAHLVIALPAFVYYVFPGNRRQVARQLRWERHGQGWLFYLLPVSCIILVLVIGTYQIIHPDTLAYHAQAIHQMEYFGTIPGIVHTDNKVAISGAWFALQAVFRFNFIHDHTFLFVNGCVVCWFCIFICLKLSATLRSGQSAKLPFPAMAWLLLLLFSFLSWTQIRLTAASASPDFITAILVWAACYNLAATPSKQATMVAVLFSAAALSMKLSAIPVLIIPLAGIMQQLQRKKILFAASLATCCVFIIAPLLVRNVYTSGYPFFPSALCDVFTVDWKMDPGKLHRLQLYITTYARIPVDDPAAFNQAAQLSFVQWLPRWWQHLYIIDKILFAVTVVLLLFNLATLPKQIKRYSNTDLLLLITALTGSLVWWFNAPDFRFGTSFLIPLIYMLCKGTGNMLPLFKQPIPTFYLRLAVHAVTAVLLLYTTYRLVYFFTGTQLLLPLGVKEVAYSPIHCQGVTLYLARDHNETGFAPPPCVPDSCQRFALRVPGDVRAGFKAAR